MKLHGGKVSVELDIVTRSLFKQLNAKNAYESGTLEKG